MARSKVPNGSDDGERIIAWRALECHGHSLHWLAAVPTLIMPPAGPLHDPPFVERLAPAASEVADGLSDSPDVPPPKVA